MEPVPFPQNKVKIHNLPDNMLIYIFRFLNLHEMLPVVPLVCRRWSRISAIPTLRKSKVITFQNDDNIDTKQACAKLVTCSANLKVLNILDREDTIDLLHAASRNNHNLQSLNIRGSKVSVKRKVLKLLITFCPDIQNIVVRDTLGLSTSYLWELSRLRNLKKVCLGSNQQKERNFFASPNGDVEHLCSSCPQLTELKLTASKWTDAVMLSILKLKNLEVLEIRFGLGLTRASIIKIPQLEHLRELDLSFIQRDMTIDAWISIFTEPSLMQLTALGFTSCSKITDKVLGVIAANCQELERIRFANCFIITEGGLAKIITKCTRLVEINVYCTKWSVAKSYPLIPVHIPRLRLLVAGPPPYPDYVQERLTFVQSELPFLKLQNEYKL